MALFCARYLTSKPFHLLSPEQIRTYALTGYYGFQDYAAAHWYEHFAISAALDDEPGLVTSAFRQCAQEFLAEYITDRTEFASKDSTEDVCTRI
jgi:hypothetical protein